jgi:hypothetical protein
MFTLQSLNWSKGLLRLWLVLSLAWIAAAVYALPRPNVNELFKIRQQLSDLRSGDFSITQQNEIHYEEQRGTTLVKDLSSAFDLTTAVPVDKETQARLEKELEKQTYWKITFANGFEDYFSGDQKTYLSMAESNLDSLVSARSTEIRAFLEKLFLPPILLLILVLSGQWVFRGFLKPQR